MSLNFGTTFGQRSNAPGQAPGEPKPKAQFWLNVGVATEVTLADGTKEPRFVSLPMGIPLDTTEKLKTNSSNEFFAQFQAARNDLLEQLIAVAKTLKPGEERIFLGGDSGLSIQIRRINAESEAVRPENNMFRVKLDLAA